MPPVGAVRLRLDGEEIALQTQKGLFSYGHIDPGMSVLLQLLPPPPVGGDLLDLGCGYGPIAVALAWRYPARIVWAVDVDQAALAVTRANVARLGLTNVRVAPPAEAEGIRFAAIYSNPPVRVGKVAMRALLLFWLARLRPEGRAYLVVKKNLGADSFVAYLAAEGHPTLRLRSRRGYRVLEVRGHDPPVAVASGVVDNRPNGEAACCADVRVRRQPLPRPVGRDL